MTAAEIVRRRADATRANMELTAWTGESILKREDRICNFIYLEFISFSRFAVRQARRTQLCFVIKCRVQVHEGPELEVLRHRREREILQN